MRDDDKDDLPTLDDMAKFAREVILVPPVEKLDDDEKDEKPKSH
ncbi:MAG: hypothetical protein V6Z81_00485 [Parvularculales bacterium]